MRLFRVLTLCATALPSALVAQEAPSTILVLDGSGSMWGQIDGKAKITIAQSVVGDLLGTLPDDINLGLTVYGHREKGNCRDIETIVAPAPGTHATIASAVAGIKPKGKTPLSDAVRQAAESLRYTEEKATVILVSDGRETCNADPCAVGRALEEAGVDFTTHVVGFDVSGDEVARAQLQCLAEATGGTYVQADDANTLSQALIAIAEEPEPVAVSITFRALDGNNGPVLSSDILWTLTDDTGAQTRLDGAMPDLSLFDGAYTASALRLTDEEERETQFTVAGSTLDVTVTFPFALPSATVTGPDTAVIGSTIEVSWDGPAGDGDFVSVHEVNGDVWPINYSAISNGNPLALRMPGQPGKYELRYQIARDRTVIARTPIEITDALVTMEAPDTAEIGATIQIQWTGPDHRGDFISVHEVNGDVWPINYTATNEGTPLDLRMPS
ncbi:MAG: VWA domain-containing protein, partial [Pelagimonas sp.]